MYDEAPFYMNYYFSGMIERRQRKNVISKDIHTPHMIDGGHKMIAIIDRQTDRQRQANFGRIILAEKS